MQMQIFNTTFKEDLCCMSLLKSLLFTPPQHIWLFRFASSFHLRISQACNRMPENSSKTAGDGNLCSSASTGKKKTASKGGYSQGVAAVTEMQIIYHTSDRQQVIMHKNAET